MSKAKTRINREWRTRCAANLAILDSYIKPRPKTEVSIEEICAYWQRTFNCQPPARHFVNAWLKNLTPEQIIAKIDALRQRVLSGYLTSESAGRIISSEARRAPQGLDQPLQPRRYSDN